MSDIRQQVVDLVAAIDEAIAIWEHQMDMWSQEKPGEKMPEFEQSFWDKLHHLQGLDLDQAEQYNWVLGLGY